MVENSSVSWSKVKQKELGDMGGVGLGGREENREEFFGDLGMKTITKLILMEIAKIYSTVNQYV